jgi:hypothetical protein
LYVNLPHLARGKGQDGMEKRNYGTLTLTLSLRERAEQELLSGYTNGLQLFQRRIFVLQEPNLCVVRAHPIAQQANRLQG